MDNEENEVVKERPAQIDVRYRPGTFGFTNSKNLTDTERDDEKSPYEKMLEDETEKENRRRQAIGLGFVLGSPNDDTDGTILFNYDEALPTANEDEEYRNESFEIDSDSTLNNALRRAIREQQDEEMNKRFMEGGSSESSLETAGSNTEMNERDIDVALKKTPTITISKTELKPFDSSERPAEKKMTAVEDAPAQVLEETQTQIHDYEQHEKMIQPQDKVQKTSSQPSDKLLNHDQCDTAVNKTGQTEDNLTSQSHNQQQSCVEEPTQTQSSQTQEQWNEKISTQEENVRSTKIQRPEVTIQQVSNSDVPEMRTENNPEQIALHDGDNSHPVNSAKVKKMNFLKRIFGKKSN